MKISLFTVDLKASILMLLGEINLWNLKTLKEKLIKCYIFGTFFNARKILSVAALGKSFAVLVCIKRTS